MLLENVLSNQQLEFFGIVDNLKCLSKEQATYILRNIYNYSEARTELMIGSLVQLKYIDYVLDGTILVAGNKQRGDKEPVNRKRIESLSVALDYIKTTDDMKSLIVTDEGYDFSFILDNHLYKCVHVDNDSLYKINLFQQEYDTLMKRVGSSKKLIEAFSYTTILVISAACDSDMILETLEAYNLSIPHLIAVLTTEDIAKKHEYELYGSIME